MPGAFAQTARVQHSNGLSITFQELLTVVVRIRAGRIDAPPNMESFHARAHEMVRQAEEEARRRGYSGEDARLALFAVVVFFDESVLQSGNPLFRDWPRRPLRSDLFTQGNIGGDTFYEHVRDLLRADDSA